MGNTSMKTVTSGEDGVVELEDGWAVNSKSKKGVVYRVRYSRCLRQMVCNCPDFRYNRMKRGEICKHISQVWDHEKYNKKDADEEGM